MSKFYWIVYSWTWNYITSAVQCWSESLSTSFIRKIFKHYLDYWTSCLCMLLWVRIRTSKQKMTIFHFLLLLFLSINNCKATCESGFKFKENAKESIKIDYQTSDDGVYSNFKKIRIIFPNVETIFDCLEQSEETSVEVTIKYQLKVRIFWEGHKIFSNFPKFLNLFNITV